MNTFEELKEVEVQEIGVDSLSELPTQLIVELAPSSIIYKDVLFQNSDKICTLVYVPKLQEFYRLIHENTFNIPPEDSSKLEICQHTTAGQNIIWKTPKPRLISFYEDITPPVPEIHLDNIRHKVDQLAAVNAILQKQAETLLKSNSFVQSLVADFVNGKPSIVAVMISKDCILKGESPLPEQVEGVPIVQVEDFVQRCGIPPPVTTVEGDVPLTAAGSFSGIVKRHGRYYGMTCVHCVYSRSTEKPPQSITIGGGSRLVRANLPYIPDRLKSLNKGDRGWKLQKIKKALEKNDLGEIGELIEKAEEQKRITLTIHNPKSLLSCYGEVHLPVTGTDTNTIPVGLDVVLFPLDEELAMQNDVEAFLKQFTPMPVVGPTEMDTNQHLYFQSWCGSDLKPS